jgi:hypothetical protein
MWVLLLLVLPARAEAPWLNPTQAVRQAQPAAVAPCPPEPEPPAPAAWDRAGFKRAKVERLAVPEVSNATHEFPLTLVHFRGSRWTSAEIRARVPKIARVYAQCGVRIRRATFVESEPWRDQLDMRGGDNPELGVERSIAAALPPGVDRPTLFFVRSFEDGTMAVANPPYYVPAGHPLLNTAFLSDSGVSESKDAPYSTEAHELAHILGNLSQHTRGPGSDLMSDARFAPPNGTLTPSQCDQVRRNSSLVKKISKR